MIMGWLIGKRMNVK